MSRLELRVLVCVTDLMRGMKEWSQEGWPTIEAERHNLYYSTF